MRAAVAKRFTPAPGEGASERAVATVINSSWPVLSAAASTEKAKAMIAARNTSGYIASLPWAEYVERLGRTTEPLARQIARTVDAAVGDLEGLAANLTFTNQDAVSIRYAQQQGSKLIVNLQESQRAAIRSVMGQALSGRYTVDEAAAIVRRSIGLHPAWADAVTRFHARQFEALRSGGMASGRAMATADRRANAYAARLVKRRSLTIARTEIQTASNLGRYATWAQMIGSGVARPDSLKEWAAGPGACPQCFALSGQVVRWDKNFSTGTAMPPAHPNCRCTAELIPARYGERELDAREIDWTSPILGTPEEAGILPGVPLRDPLLDPRFDPPGMDPAAVDRAVKLISRQDLALSDYADEAVDVYNAAKGIRTWTQGQDGMDTIKAGGDVADAFSQVLSAAPRTDTVLYRGMVVDDLEDFVRVSPGDTIPVHTAASFTSSRRMVDNYLMYDDEEDVLSGVILKLTGGRALPVGRLGGSGLESEWITNTPLTVTGVEKIGESLWQISVTQ